MSVVREEIPLLGAFSSIVVRPRPGRSPQTLVFLAQEARELCWTSTADGTQTYELSSWSIPFGRHCCNCNAVYEATTDCIYFAAFIGSDRIRDAKGLAVRRLNADNTVSFVAGSEEVREHVDGTAGEARFNSIRAMDTDGRGNIFIAGGRAIRVLDARSSRVVTLRVSFPASSSWNSMSYDSTSDVLMAAVGTAICRIPLTRDGDRIIIISSSGSKVSDSEEGNADTAPRLVAGSLDFSDSTDGPGTTARFKAISSILTGAGGSLYILDVALRHMDAAGTVTTLCRAASDATYLHGMVFLPNGQMAVGMRNEKSKQISIYTSSSFAPSAEALAVCRPSTATQLPRLLLMPTNPDGGSTTPAIITIRVGGGKAYLAHRAALVARSDFLRQRLAPDGGFGDSGSAEVSLLDADPDAFGHLLGYMYTGELHVSDVSLRAAVELAQELLLPPDCSRALQRQLWRAITPASVVSALVWADRYALTELVSDLKAYFLEHRREVASHAGLAGFSRQCPELADELMQGLLGS